MGWDNIRVDAIGLAAEVVELRNEIARLNGQTNWVCSCGGTDCKGQQENADLRGTLDAVIEADGRAADLWRAAHPGNELVIPDRAKLVGWLLEENAALRKDKARLDWLTESLGWIVVGYPDADPSQHATEDNTISDAWRAAIDAARKEAQPYAIPYVKADNVP